MLKALVGSAIERRRAPTLQGQALAAPESFKRLFTAEDKSEVYTAFDGLGGHVASSEQADALLQRVGVAIPAQQLKDCLTAIGHVQGVPLSADDCVLLVQCSLYGLLVNGPSDAAVAFDALGGGPRGVPLTAVAHLLGQFQLPPTLASTRRQSESDIDHTFQSPHTRFQRSTSSSGSALVSRHSVLFSELESEEEEEEGSLSLAEFTAGLAQDSEGPREGDLYSAFERQLRSCTSTKMVFVPPACSKEEQSQVLRPPRTLEAKKSADPTNAMKSVIFREILSNRVRMRQQRRMAEQRIAARELREKKLKELLLKPARPESANSARHRSREHTLTMPKKPSSSITVKQTLSKGSCHIDITEPVQEKRVNTADISMEHIACILDRASRINVGALRARKQLDKARPSSAIPRPSTAAHSPHSIKKSIYTITTARRGPGLQVDEGTPRDSAVICPPLFTSSWNKSNSSIPPD